MYEEEEGGNTDKVYEEVVGAGKRVGGGEKIDKLPMFDIDK